ncbi:MAG: A24 family peptidase [Candidatus Micrarchaeia archaeon]
MALEFAIAILFLAVASYYDVFNKRTIPDWLSYSFIIVALLSTVLTAGVDFIKIGVAIAVFAIGYLIYRVGYIGGADVFFITGLVLLLPITENSNGVGIPVIVNVLLISTLTMAVYLEFSFFAQKRKVEPRMQEIITAIVWIVGYLAIAYLLSSLGLVLLAGLAVVVGAISSVFALIKRDLAKSLIIEVAPKDIIEEDILAVEEMDPKVVERLKLERLLTKEQIKRIKDAGLESVPIYGKLPPYMPFLLVGVVAALVLSLMP